MKEIPGFPDYFINKSGEVYSMAPRSNRGRPKQPVKISTYLKHGYHAIDLSRDGKSYKKYVHRLILEVFRSKCPKGYQCRHLNGVRTDNRLENLKWGSRSENQMDRARHGTSNAGESHPQSKYTEAFV